MAWGSQQKHSLWQQGEKKFYFYLFPLTHGIAHTSFKQAYMQLLSGWNSCSSLETGGSAVNAHILCIEEKRQQKDALKYCAWSSSFYSPERHAVLNLIFKNVCAYLLKLALIFNTSSYKNSIIMHADLRQAAIDNFCISNYQICIFSEMTLWTGKQICISVDEQICQLLSADVSVLRRGQYLVRGQIFRLNSKYWHESYSLAYSIWEKQIAEMNYDGFTLFLQGPELSLWHINIF